MAFKEYDDPKLLRRVQLVLTRVLGELDRVCRELDIPYVVYGGTAIGVVRHHGFIPWDDDADVCMTRADYERFLVEAPAVLGSEFALENARTHAEYPNMFTNLVVKGGLFIPEFIKRSPYRMPLGVDIFPLDNVPDDRGAYRRQSLSTWFWGRLLYLQGSPHPYLEIDGWRKRVILAATSTIYAVLHVFQVKPRMLQQRWEKAARRYENQRTRLMADFTDRNPLAWAVSYDDLYPALDASFEGITVKLPREYDKILTRGYGDYMQLPPLEKRKNHQPFIIDLGEYGAEELG